MASFKDIPWSLIKYSDITSIIFREDSKYCSSNYKVSINHKFCKRVKIIRVFIKTIDNFCRVYEWLLIYIVI